MADLLACDIIHEALIKSGYSNINVIPVNQMYEFSFEKINSYSIIAFCKYICKSGWSDKPDIRRVQIPAYDTRQFSLTTRTKSYMIIGVQELFGKYIFVVWNAYQFGNHKTNRSCYVKVSNLFQAYNKGYLSVLDSEHKIWVSDEYHLSLLINDYISYNLTTLGD